MSFPHHRTRTSFVDELSSSISHGIGGYLGVAAMVLLILFAIESGTQVA